ncbi:MAG TPA: glycerate kinase [Arsenophonus apicola]|uniref:glycerate kinase n=1 Tax=Arsenophonus apicola TaxID=2879119 RepID=UPI003878F8CE
MKIIIAPDSFKESLTAKQAACAIKAGFMAVFPAAEYVCFPMADGGEGTVDAFIAAKGGQRIEVTVAGPLKTPVKAYYGLLNDGDTAVIEMAAASGLMQVPLDQRNPLLTTSFGTGQLILAALDYGVKKIILAVGGSATVDGGIGMMQALGARFYRKDGHLLELVAKEMVALQRIDLSTLDSRLQQCQIEIVCDVNNPLIGEQGAAKIFAPQKGATREMVSHLEQGLIHYADIIQSMTGTDYRYLPGSGAGGGISIAALAFLNATLRSGIETVCQAMQFKDELATTDLVIVGEGSMDGQTLGGKAPIGIAKLAAKSGIPVIAIVGIQGKNIAAVYQQGINAVFSILPCLLSQQAALAQGELNLQHCAYNVAKVLQTGIILAKN